MNTPSDPHACYAPNDGARPAAAPDPLPLTRPLLEEALAAKPALAALSSEEKKAVLLSMADALEADTEAILAANARDLDAAQGTIAPVMQDRLRLTAGRIADMAAGVRAVAQLPDPVGRTLSAHTLPNGLQVDKVSVPLGVIAIIYESRPNVTSDAASLTFQAGSVCVLRGGKESIHSNTAIVAALHKALHTHHLPQALVSLVTDTTRASAGELMQAVGYVDLLIPRGGASLIQTCVDQAKVPCIQTGTGICHLYVDGDADPDKALSVVENAKTSRPSVCNAAEVCLVHQDIAPTFLPALWQRLVDDRRAAGQPPVELRLDPAAHALLGKGTPAGTDDFDTEFLDYVLAVRVVGSVEEAIDHINRHSTGHSEAILTQTRAHADLFTRLVDSAAVYVNASTRFTDGGQFGLGCEMGISTQKLHARGPMGLEELTSYKYVITGDGQIR
ncbi:MAG: glutamate-5-semialdehyde dehydrogenase [Clostridiales bacterium]|nr:glutamate-5-semialdehyde dehydrogenase [Clostridiales bacterium]